MQAAAPHSGETILASPHRPRQGSGSFGYAIAVPPKGAVVLGLIFSAIAMGVVTVQVFMYSHRWYKERRTGVFILYGIFLYNLFSIAFLGEAVYHWLITGFYGGDINYITVPQRYTLVMIPGVISRAIVSCILALITASLIHNGLVGLVLHVLTASRIALMAFVVQVTYQSFASNSSFGNVTPPLLKAHNALAMFTEALVCTLFGAAMYRESRGNSGTTNSGISQKNRQVILSYSFHLVWYIAFVSGMWKKSPFQTACFGIPLGAVCNVTFLILLHAYPSLPMPTLLLNGFRRPPRQGAAVARVLTTRDVAIESCHDGPLELQLMERLDRMFPEEEEIRSYDPELDVPISTTDGPRKPPKPPNALIA